MMNVDEDILVRYLDDALSVEEKAQVETWRATSDENEKMVEQIYYTLQLTERLKVMQAVDTDKAFARFKAKRKRHNGLGISWLSLQRIAAVLFIPLLLLTGYLLLRNEQDRSMVVETMTNPGIVSTFDLPDGTKVWLNSGSSLKYAADFTSNKREVELTGEAFFVVAKDEAKPFVVHAGTDYSVEVLGTSFNVMAYPEEEIIATTLVEGSVSIEALTESGKSTFRLNPNEKAEYQKVNKEVDVKPINTETDTGWTKGEIIFKQESMENVLKKLSRHYNVEFDVKSEEVMEAIITARFKDEQLTQVMEYLKMASGLNYVIHKPEMSAEGDEKKTTVVEIYK